MRGWWLLFRHRMVQPPIATTRTSSVMLRMTPSPLRRRKFTDREPPGSHLKSAAGAARSVKSTRFSPWEKLSRDATDEGLVVVI
jgi:hypothetical protein